MEEQIHKLLDILRDDESTLWIVDQLTATYAEGLSQSAKDTSPLVQSEYIEVTKLTTREKAKREKYETSRPYTEHEKLELANFALSEVFLTLPAMRDSTTKALQDLGSQASLIEFSVPDEEEREEGSYAQPLVSDAPEREELKRRLEVFLQRLAS